MIGSKTSEAVDLMTCVKGGVEARHGPGFVVANDMVMNRGRGHNTTAATITTTIT